MKRFVDHQHRQEWASRCFTPDRGADFHGMAGYEGTNSTIADHTIVVDALGFKE